MGIKNEVTGKTFIAGCFLLALVPRVEARNFSGEEPPGLYLFPANRIYLLPTYGTLGAGWETRYEFSSAFKLRFWHASQDLSESNTRRSFDYDLKLKILSNSAIFDWHVFGGKFRTSAGMVFGRTELSANGFYGATSTLQGQTWRSSDVIAAANELNPSQTFTAGRWTVTGADLIQWASTLDPNQQLTSNTTVISASNLLQASAVARYPSYAPYFGVGWGNSFNPRKGGFLYSIDVGVMYLGRPKVDLLLSGPVANLAQQYYSVGMQTYLETERHKIDAALSKYRYYPVVSVGVWFRF